jgi:hypothetical protein
VADAPRASRRLAAAALAAVLAGAPAADAGAAGKTLRLDVLALVFTHTFADEATPAEVERVRAEIDEAAQFFRTASRGRLRLAVDTLVVDRYLREAEFWEVKPETYWLGVGSTEEGWGVASDLARLGVDEDAFDVVAALYAWEEAPGQRSEWGGAAYPVRTVLARAAYLAIPLAWGPDSLDDYLVHELMHALESIFDANGYAPFPAVHGAEIFRALAGPDADWNEWILAELPDRAYFAPTGGFGRVEAGD